MALIASHAVVWFADGPPASLEALARDHPDEVTVLRSAGFNAHDPGTVEALIVIAPIVIREVAKTVREHIKAGRQAGVKVDGIELTGVSGKDALAVLDELAGQRSSEA